MAARKTNLKDPIYHDDDADRLLVEGVFIRGDDSIELVIVIGAARQHDLDALAWFAHDAAARTANFDRASEMHAHDRVRLFADRGDARFERAHPGLDL